MKFIVDAQFPRALAKRLKELGHDAKHTWGLEDSNRTPDTDIARIADRAQAVVITKDCHFLCILKCLSLKMSLAKPNPNDLQDAKRLKHASTA
jgi:predicted nuclease of predicted toxin-antitoxin system